MTRYEFSALKYVAGFMDLCAQGRSGFSHIFYIYPVNKPYN